MGMPAFDDNLKSLREHLVNRRKNLQMGGMPVAGRRIHISSDRLCLYWKLGTGAPSTSEPKTTSSFAQAAGRSHGAHRRGDEEVRRNQCPFHEQVPELQKAAESCRKYMHFCS